MGLDYTERIIPCPLSPKENKDVDPICAVQRGKLKRVQTKVLKIL